MEKFLKYKLVVIIIQIFFLGFWFCQTQLPKFWEPIHTWELAWGSATMGGLGGVSYCLRAIYINICAKKIWDTDWTWWYYLRPLTSPIAAFTAFIFLKAGLLMFSTPQSIENQLENMWAFYAVSFIAGYNVDNFFKRLERLAESLLGLSSSNIGKESK